MLGIITRMSQRDLQQNRATLIGFKERPCFASLATNSIRFRFDARDKQGHYIWVDPPWVFSSDAGQITTSSEYAEDTFEEWCSLFSALRETVLLDFEAGENGETTFIFFGGYRLFIQLDSGSDSLDSDYDQWYAHDA